jgi:hypothetical protein
MPELLRQSVATNQPPCHMPAKSLPVHVFQEPKYRTHYIYEESNFYRVAFTVRDSTNAGSSMLIVNDFINGNVNGSPATHTKINDAMNFSLVRKANCILPDQEREPQLHMEHAASQQRINVELLNTLKELTANVSCD